jgi:hypothetical protein
MTSVGYGDILAVDTPERVYALVTMLFGGFFYGYMISTMAHLVNNLDTNARLVAKTMDTVCAFIQETKLPYKLAFRIRRESKYFLQRKTALDEHSILVRLTRSSLFLRRPHARSHHARARAGATPSEAEAFGHLVPAWRACEPSHTV